MGGSRFDHIGIVGTQAMSSQAVAAVEPQEQTIAQPGERSQPRTKRQPPYHVVLWNDDDHSYEYVIRMLLELFGHPLEKGFQLAKEVDSQGRGIDDHPGTCRAETRPDPCLWQRRPDRRLQGFDGGDDRAGGNGIRSTSAGEGTISQKTA